MNPIQRIHGHPHTHPHEGDSHSHNAPFWVRHYDTIVALVTLGRTSKIYQGTLTLAEVKTGNSVLDIGCGTGKLILEAEKIVGHEGTTVGLDVEPVMIEQARRRAAKNNSQAIFEVASIEQIPFEEDTFDVVISSLVYHHLTERQKSEGLAELKRVLKPNGRLLIVDLNPSRRGIATSLPGHNQLESNDYVRNEVTDQMQKVGFTNIQAGPHPYRQLSYALGEKS